ncbi:hypothetical protein [Vreelandella massiliensis]|uniref:hypothetical protein n=1 Tax=Vreelandella massiliensis TaxID=1816686 RepID=UPI00096A462B|nr:hypothetical protein [Halomonas massiliensis]
MKALTAIIDWFGPYTLEQVREVTKFDFDDGLYVLIGKQPFQRKSWIQYIGIAKSLKTRLTSQHPAVGHIPRDLEIWLGEVASPRTPGRKMKVTDNMLDLAEWSHAYYLQLPLNKNKRKTPPFRPITTYNRWWRIDYETPYLKRPHADWPDFIDHLGEDYLAKVVWFGGKQIKGPVSDFKK